MWNFCEPFFATLPSWLQSFLLLLFPFFDLHSRLSWFYTLSFIALALGSYWLSKQDFTDRSWRKAIAYCFPKSLYTSRSAILDWQCYLMNGTFKVVVNLTALASMATAIAAICTRTLEATFGPVGFEVEVNLWLVLCHTVLAIFILDFSAFLSHYWLHKIPFLWEFHKVHHIAEGLTPITGFRDHPMDVVFKKTLRAFILGLYLGAFNYVTSGQIYTITIGGTMISTFLFDFTIDLRHSHIWISYGWHLEHIFCSPAMHQIHHSKAERHINKNFARIFSFWDYLFGTIYVPARQESLSVGIPGEPDYENIWQLYCQPFAKAYATLGSTIGSRLRSS